MTPTPAALAAVRPNLAWGWTLLATFMLGGLTLESFHGVKLAPYMDHALRRELWTLAHAHGALLALVNLAFAATGPRLLPASRLARTGTALRWGALLMPLGFLLGGVGNTESDPSLAILLTPVGALLVLYAAVDCAWAAWRGANDAPDTVGATAPVPARREPDAGAAGIPPAGPALATAGAGTNGRRPKGAKR